MRHNFIKAAARVIASDKTVLCEQGKVLASLPTVLPNSRAW